MVVILFQQKPINCWLDYLSELELPSALPTTRVLHLRSVLTQQERFWGDIRRNCPDKEGAVKGVEQAMW